MSQVAKKGIGLAPLAIRLGHLYPDHLNIYGDRGNVVSLVYRAQCMGIAVQVVSLGLGTAFNPQDVDILFMGGGQDCQQLTIADDLHAIKAPLIKAAVEQGAVMLGICGGYQLMGHYYQPHEGDRVKGLGLVDAYTVAGHRRMIGNVIIERPDGQTLVGFENHSGQTYLGSGVTPLGQVRQGAGNNGKDGTEGIWHILGKGTLMGTYLHGSLLPKNPMLADQIIQLALAKTMDASTTQALMPAHAIEQHAHDRALSLRY